MGIYFRDILLTRISRGANNCGQHPLEKNSYFIMRFSPHFQLFYFNDRLEFCEFFEGKIKRINNADLFSQLPLLIFIKGANISGGHCIYIYIKWCVCVSVYLGRVSLFPQENASSSGSKLKLPPTFQYKAPKSWRQTHTLCPSLTDRLSITLADAGMDLPWADCPLQRKVSDAYVLLLVCLCYYQYIYLDFYY